MKLKKITSILLALMMLFGVFSPACFAAEGETGEELTLMAAEDAVPEEENAEGPAEAPGEEEPDDMPGSKTSGEEPSLKQTAAQAYPWDFSDDEAFTEWVTDPDSEAYILSLFNKGGKEWKLFSARVDEIEEDRLRKTVLACLESICAEEEYEDDYDEYEELPFDGEELFEEALPENEETVPEEEEYTVTDESAQEEAPETEDIPAAESEPEETAETEQTAEGEEISSMETEPEQVTESEQTAEPEETVEAEETEEPEQTAEAEVPEVSEEISFMEIEPEQTEEHEQTFESEQVTEPEQTAEPEQTVEPTDEPEQTVEPTAEPELIAEPTAEPEQTVVQTAEPEQTAEPTEEPEQTAAPEETAVEVETAEAAPTSESDGEEPFAQGEGEEIPGEEGEEPSEPDAEAAEGVFPGPPEGFTLSNKQKEKKAELRDSGITETLAKMQDGKDYETGKLIFACSDKAYAQTVADIYGAKLTDFGYGVATITLSNGTVREAVALAADTDNEYPPVEPNYVTPMEKDPQKLMTGSGNKKTASESESWNIWIGGEDPVLSNPDPYLKNPSSFSYQWQHDMMNTYEAWGVTTGKESVLVAVIDSGVNVSHPDLDNVTAVDIGLGTEPYSRSEHGTHVAGIIAASLGNGLGGAGIAPGVSLLSVRVVSNSGGISNANLVKGINAAVEAGADIINISIGGIDHAQVLEDALKTAYNKGVTVIASAGNNGDNTMFYPAAYDTVIAVANVDKDGKRASSSSYGSWVDISAPGEDIMSTTRSSYGMLSGTSMASPMVAGAAALYMSRMGHVSPQKMRSVLTSAVTKTDSSGMGAGIINAAKLFSGDKTAPGFEVNGTAVSGSVSAKINGKLYFTGRETDAVIYTTDGSEPVIANGKAFRGTLCEDGYIALSSLGTVGKTVTVKASYVNSIGVQSKSATLKVTLTDSSVPEAMRVIAPKALNAGKSAKLGVEVKPAAASDSVVWTITGRSGAAGTTLSKDGVLKAAKTDRGSVTVRATSKVNPQLYAEATVEIKLVDLVKSISLTKSGTLIYRKGFSDEKQLTVKFKTKSGAVLPQAGEGSNEGIAAAWSSSNTKVVTVDANGKVTAVGAGSAKVTCTAMDGSGKKKSCTIKVLRGVDSLTVTGQSTIASGTSATYKVAFSPAKPANKAVTWSLENAPKGVGISTKGKLTVAPGLQKTEFTVRATAKDGSGATDTMTVTIVPRVSSLKLKAPSATEGVSYTISKGVLKTLMLYTVDIASTDKTENKVTLPYDCNGPKESLVWTSSNPAVASVDANGVVTAKKSGKTTVTVRANDGSGKKAAVKVTVKVPASSLRIVPPRTTNAEVCYVGVGTSAANTVSVGSAYGTPGKSKIQWAIETVLSDGYNVTSQWKSKKWATVSSSGVLKINKSASAAVDNGEDVYLILSATRTDDGIDAEYIFKIVPKVTQLFTIPDTVWLSRQKGDGRVPYDIVSVYSNVPEVDCFSVSSSNPAVAGASLTDGGLEVYSNTKAGTAVITVKALDGSGLSTSVKVIVSDN